MPPKTKPVPKPSSLHENNETPAPSSEILTMIEGRKIPNKPFFRTIKIHSLNKISEVRIKLWKLKSWTLETGSRFEPNPYNQTVQTIKNLSSSTFRKSLKFIKNFDFSKNRLIRIPDLKKVFPYLSKADSLALVTNQANPSTKTFLKKFLNPQLRHIYLDTDFLALQNEEGNRFLKKVLMYLNKVQRCMHRVKIHPPSCSMLVTTQQPIKFSKVPPQNQENAVLKPLILSLGNSIQELSIDLSYTPYLGNVENLQDIQFPHLKKFKYKFSRMFQVRPENHLSPVYLSFLGNCPSLEAVNLDLNWVQIESLDFLAFLPKLRDFSLKSEKLQIVCFRAQVPDIPAIATLERLKIHIDFGTVNIQNVSQIIQMNPGLKTLEIILSMDRIIEAFTENIELPLLENLTFGVLQIDLKNQKQLKALQTLLLRFKHVAKLDLQLDAFFVDCLHPSLKTLEQFSNLKELRITALHAGQLEDKKFSKFKDLFKKMPNLRSLELGFGYDLMNSRELSSLVDGLVSLENLEEFYFKAFLAKITSASFIKFASFLESRRKIKEMRVQVKGLSVEEEKELQGILSQRYKLWEEMIE